MTITDTHQALEAAAREAVCLQLLSRRDHELVDAVRRALLPYLAGGLKHSATVRYRCTCESTETTSPVLSSPHLKKKVSICLPHVATITNSFLPKGRGGPNDL